MVEPVFLALTRTPSIAASCAELTVPCRATGPDVVIVCACRPAEHTSAQVNTVIERHCGVTEALPGCNPEDRSLFARMLYVDLGRESPRPALLAAMISDRSRATRSPPLLSP